METSPSARERSADALRGAVRRLRGQVSPPVGERLALASLRSSLDGDPEATRWSIHTDGVLGRGLVMAAGAAYRTPLTLGSATRLAGRVLLLPHDWLNRRGELTASISVTLADQTAKPLWSTSLLPADRGHPRGSAFDCALPVDAVAVTLSLSPAPCDRRIVGRALWLEPALYDAVAPAPAAAPIGAPVRAVGARPLLSVLMPVHDPPPRMLQEAIASVLAQTYPEWELCLVDDGSRNPAIRAALAQHAENHRIKLTTHDRARGISAATNAALALAEGEFVALLDHDDTLTPDALATVAETLSADPELDMVYSDEDVIADGVVRERHIKPGWSPEHMRALMYTCHLGVYRRSLAETIGGFQSRYDGCQDYDFVLRMMERTDRVAHIPRILYHWRAHRDSTAGGDAKPYAYLAQPGAIAAHLERSQIDADVQFAHLPGLHRIVHRVDQALQAELLVAATSADSEWLERAARSWAAQQHPGWRVTVATGAPDAASRALQRAGLPAERVTVIEAEGGSADALHHAATAARGEQLVLMQTPTAGLTDDWLTRLLGYTAQPEIAAAGPVILTPEGRIQQAGVALPAGIPLYLNYGRPVNATQPVVYNLSAVSGVLVTSRACYEEIGGLRSEHGEQALVEYCLRAGSAGRRIVLVPDARMQAPNRPINDVPALWRLRAQWATTRHGDPYYSPSYRADRGDFIPR